MKIGNREIGPWLPPIVVAEVGANHGGSLERAMDCIDAAKAVGADAVKFQAYTPDTITLDCNRPEFMIKDGPWKGRRLYDLYKSAHTPFEWFQKIAARANEVGITWFASVFDPSSVDELERLGCPAYKIASFEIVDLPLIRYVVKTGKPLIISSGMASEDDIDAVADLLNEEGAPFANQIVLACVSEYPAKPESYCLKRALTLNDGISDHTLGNEVAIAATALGAQMIEKHFKLDYNLDTEDAPFSLVPSQFRQMVESVKTTWAAVYGKPSDIPSPQRQMRRSLFAVADIRKGEAFTHENVRSIRPGDGLPPDEISRIIGKVAVRDIERGEPMAWGMVG